MSIILRVTLAWWFVSRNQKRKKNLIIKEQIEATKDESDHLISDHHYSQSAPASHEMVTQEEVPHDTSWWRGLLNTNDEMMRKKEKKKDNETLGISGWRSLKKKWMPQTKQDYYSIMITPHPLYSFSSHGAPFRLLSSHDRSCHGKKRRSSSSSIIIIFSLIHYAPSEYLFFSHMISK